VRNDNHAYFRFFGGMTDAARRARRARMISIVLERHDFLVEVSGDFIIGRLKKFDTEAMLQRMAVLGLLIGFTRQLDVSMRADSSIGSCVDDFMRLVYSIPARS
jgi:pyruvate,water dikinase